MTWEFLLLFWLLIWLSFSWTILPGFIFFIWFTIRIRYDSLRILFFQTFNLMSHHYCAAISYIFNFNLTFKQSLAILMFQISVPKYQKHLSIQWIQYKTTTYYNLNKNHEVELSPFRQCQQKLNTYELCKSRIYGWAVVIAVDGTGVPIKVASECNWQTLSSSHSFC